MTPAVKHPGKKLILAIGGFVLLFVFFAFLTTPSLKSLRNYAPNVSTEIFSQDGTRIGEFSLERRFFVPYKNIPTKLIEAVVAAEDDQFFHHNGISVTGVTRAFFKNLISGSVRQGGSTITQQVAKSAFLSPHRSWLRKIREVILAYKLERTFTKEHLLEIYLNEIYFGSGAYGVVAAADTYFDKSLAELTLSEMATLAGLIRAPSRDNPKVSVLKAIAKRNYVLNRMLEEKKINLKTYQTSLTETLTVSTQPHLNERYAPYFVENVRQYLVQKYGDKKVLTGGLRVYTRLDSDAALAADRALKEGIEEVERHQGYRGPMKRVSLQDYESVKKAISDENAHVLSGMPYQALVTKVDDKNKRVSIDLGSKQGVIPLSLMDWARKPNPKQYWAYQKIQKPSLALKERDLIWVKPHKRGGEYALFQPPEVQGALISMNPFDGAIHAMVGGYDFKKSQFNRAIQARRQAGSIFKPIIYAAALQKGYTPATVLIDEPLVYRWAGTKADWKPQNYEKKFEGTLLLRDCLIQSRNIPTIKILKSVGVERTIKLARDLGIESDLYPNLSLALGASSVTPLEMVKAYSVFANGGSKIKEPLLISKVMDRSGKVLETMTGSLTPVLSPQLSFLMTHLLEEVVKYGTGRAAGLGARPVAGKTGTTDDNRDAWFVGYTPELVTAVWIGYDNASKGLGEKEDGGKIASPIWSAYMGEALRNLPPAQFEQPSGLITATVDRKTGKLSSIGNHVTEYFIEGTEPIDSADILEGGEINDESLLPYTTSVPHDETISLPASAKELPAPVIEQARKKLSQDFFLNQ